MDEWDSDSSSRTPTKGEGDLQMTITLRNGGWWDPMAWAPNELSFLEEEDNSVGRRNWKQGKHLLSFQFLIFILIICLSVLKYSNKSI